MENKKRLVWIEEVETELRAYADRKHAYGQTELANGILKAVNHLQTITKAKDCVQVVRCKDCKHYNKESLWCGMNSEDRGEWFNWYAEDFCSYGERKDNEAI